MKNITGIALGGLTACLLAAAPVNAQIPTGVTFESIYDQGKIGFLQPTYIGPVPGDAGQLIIVERAGKVYRLVLNGTQYEKKAWFSVDADTATHWDGAWNVEFHPDFAKNHLFYVLYRLKTGTTQSALEEWTCDPDLGNPKKLRDVLFFNQKSIHSSGDIHFGKDGYLYSSQGDRDQHDLGGPLMSELWGKVIRIDVDKKDAGLQYAIPADNPFKGTAGARPEIWAKGFRMPWRFSFDALNGDMYLGDVGDLDFEEVNIVQAGKDYGAGKVEGACKTNCAGLTDPVLPMPHGCVIGGVVYRNDPASAFYGAYIYADYALKSLSAFKLNAAKTGVTDNKKITASVPGNISTLGVDAAGNIYAATYLETPETSPTQIYRLKHPELRPGTVALRPFAQRAVSASAFAGAEGKRMRYFSLGGKALTEAQAGNAGIVLAKDAATGEAAQVIRLP